MSDLFNYYLKNNNSSLRDVSAVQDPQDSFRKKSSSVNTINNSKNSDASSLHTVRQRSRTRSADREEPTNKRVTFTSPPENPKITTNINNNTNVELLVQQRVEAYQTEREKKYQKQLQDAICAVHAQFANEYQSKEAQLEKQVLEEADHFKKEYKTILDAEYQSKKSLLEKQLQEKESIFMRRWVAETATNKAHPNTNAEWLEKTEKESAAVVEALQEVTALRDKLLAEQMEQKAALQVSFEERIRTLQQHYNTSLEKIQQANVKLQQEREKENTKYQDMLESKEKLLNEKQMEIADLRNQHGSLLARELNDKMQTVRDTINEQWSKKFEEERQTYTTQTEELRRQILKLQEEKAQLFSKLELSMQEKVRKKTESIESQLAAMYEAQIRLLEESVGQRESLTKDLEKRNSELQFELGVLQEEFVNVKQNAVKQQSELEEKERAVWHQKLIDLEHTYEQSIATMRDKYYHAADGSGSGGSIPYKLYQETCQRNMQLEGQISELRQEHHQALNAAITAEQTTWRRRLDKEREEQRAQERQLQEKFEGLKRSLLADAEEKEKYAKTRLDKEREKLETQYLHRLKTEQAELHLKLDAMQTEYDRKLSAQLQTMEKKLQEKWEADRQKLQKKEESLLQRETELTIRSSQLEDEARRSALEQLKVEKDKYYMEVENQRREVARERENLSRIKDELEMNMAKQYAKRLEENEIKFQLRLKEFLSFVSQMMDEKEQIWLESRGSEMTALRRLFDERAGQLHEKRTKTLIKTIQETTDSIRKKEEEDAAALQTALAQQLKEHWGHVLGDMEEHNAQYVERMSAVLQSCMTEHFERAQAAWEEKNDESTQMVLQYTENKLALEEEIRSQFETLLNEERENVQRRLTAQKRLHEEELTRVQIQADESVDLVRSEMEEVMREKVEKLNAQNRLTVSAVEAQLAEVRETTQKTLNEKQKELDRMRENRESDLKTQLEEQTETQELQLAELRAQCDSRIKESEAALKEERDQMKEELQAQRAALERQLTAQYQQVIEQLEAKIAALQTSLTEKELDLPRRVQEAVDAQYATLKAQYDHFVAEQAATLAERVVEKTDAYYQLQQEKEEQLCELQHSYERAVMDLETRLQETAEQKEAEREALFEKHMEAFRQVVEEERERRRQAEETVQDLQTKLDQLKSEQILAKISSPTKTTKHNSKSGGLTQRTDVNRTPSLSKEATVSGNVDTLMATLKDLYEVLEVDEKERTDFLEFIEALGDRHQKHAVLQKEIHTLQGQLPLLELWMKRNQVLEYISNNNNLDRAYIDEEDEDDWEDKDSFLQSLLEEKKKITAQLKEEIKQYERNSGRLFTFCGQRVMESL